MNNKLFLKGLFLVLLSFTACGKYAPPIPPEALAPKAVYDIQVIPYRSGVAFKWVGETKDRRSKELKTMNGYYVERACLQNDDLIGYESSKDFVADLDYEILTVVNDNQVTIREDLKKEAREKGLSARRVKVPSDKLKFNYVDETIKYNDLCYYKITPFNQDGVRGVESSPIKIKFKGEESFVMIGRRSVSGYQKVKFDN